MEKLRTPERAALADAITKLHDATAHVERLEQAQRRLQDRSIELAGQIEDAQREKVTHTDAASVASLAMHRVLCLADGDEPVEDPAENLAARIDRLEIERAKLRDARAEADELLKSAKWQLDMKKMNVRDAVEAVVSTAPEVRALFDQCRAHYRAAAILAETLGRMQSYVPQEFHRPMCLAVGDNPAPAEDWLTIVERLKVDADAAFPAVKD